MDDQKRCQSCGMPLEDGFFGTNENGDDSLDYCAFCLKNGHFSDPDMTVGDMMVRSVKRLMNMHGFDEEKAKKFAAEVIPKLKRWQKK